MRIFNFKIQFQQIFGEIWSKFCTNLDQTKLWLKRPHICCWASLSVIVILSSPSLGPIQWYYNMTKIFREFQRGTTFSKMLIFAQKIIILQAGFPFFNVFQYFLKKVVPLWSSIPKFDHNFQNNNSSGGLKWTRNCVHNIFEKNPEISNQNFILFQIKLVMWQNMNFQMIRIK